MESIADYYQRRGRQQGLRRGLKKGLEKGIEKGLEKGRSAGLRLALEQVLRLRFKRVPAETLARLSKARPTQLQAWIERAVTVRTVKSVFADDA